MENTYTVNNPMAPLWLMYPYISRYSIGWRMGNGEDYKFIFANWFTNLNGDEQKLYEEMFPAPVGWQGFYEKDFADNDIYSDEGCLFWNKDGKMKYCMELVQHDYRQGKKPDFLFFWGHQPPKDGSISKSCFSQWWKSNFAIEINPFCCMEQYMMAEKARIFDDTEILEKIMHSNEPKEIKALGRKVKNFNEELWVKNRYSIILNGNFAKFLQNEPLMKFLVNTGDAILVEASPYDRIWGIGMAADDQKVRNPLEWKGQNLLGFALMEVRDEIRRVCKNRGTIDFNKLHQDFG